MAIYNVELRKRTGSTYGDKVLVATDKSLVEGLLGGDGKILESLMPNSVFGGLRFIGYAAASTHDTTAELKTLVDSYVTSNGGTARGAFFIYGSVGALTITVSSGHAVRTDVGLRIQSETFELNSGDWMVSTNEDGTEWAVVNNTYNNATTSVAGLMSASDKTKLDGLANYNHPTGGANVNLTVDDDHKIAAIVVNSLGHVTSISTEAIRPATTSLQGLMSAADKTKLDSVAQNANNYSLPTASASVLGGIKVGSRLTISAGVLSADSQTDNNFTTVLKNKLDGIEAGANAYTHPAHTAGSLNNSGKQTIGEISIDAEGHVTWVQGRNIDTASSSTSGLVELATNAESQAGTDATRAVTPAGLESVLGFALGFPIFADLAAANSAAAGGTYKDSSYAFVEV